MSFRTRGMGQVMGAGEKSSTTCIADFACCISFLLTESHNPLLFVRNDMIYLDRLPPSYFNSRSADCLSTIQPGYSRGNALTSFILFKSSSDNTNSTDFTLSSS